MATTTDGSEAGTRGVVHAAAEAARLHTDLQILHVVPSYIPTGPIPIVPDSSFQDTAREIVDHAADAARAAAPSVDVSTSVLVIGGRAASTAERVWTGTTVTGVAARATCPVLVVPPRAAGTGETSPRGRIVAGVPPSTRARSSGSPSLHTWEPRPWASGERPLFVRLRWDRLTGRRLGTGWTYADALPVRRRV